MPDARALWDSPIGPSDVAGTHAGVLWVGQVGGEVWWVQSQPELDGRYGLFRSTGDGIERLTDDATNVRTRVHEYGGQPWAALSDGRFCFVEWDDQRLYATTIGGASTPLTPVPPRPAGLRYADPLVVGDEVWVLREELHSDEPTDLTRDFVAVPLDGSAADTPERVRPLGAGAHHFLAGLRLSPDGSKAAWIGWDHPFMSWDRSEVVVADVVDGLLVDSRMIAGGGDVSICQLEWESDDTLLFLSDVSGWWNLHRQTLGGTAEAIHPVDSELGGPLWRVGQRWFAVLAPGVFVLLDHGRLCILDERADTLTYVVDEVGLPSWSGITASDGRVAGVAHGPHRLPTVATMRDGIVEAVGDQPALPTIGDGTIDLADGWLASPELFWFEADDGSMIPTNVHRPTHPGIDDEGPAPYVVHIHGGPTGENGTGLDLEIAYFTSRGIGVAVPEYGGSTGFGRAWRERLKGQWGVIDLGDARAVALGLVAKGIADPDRLGIRGGSAGGYTTALAVTTPSPFAAGCARYPVVELLAFAQGETHDLESQYLSGIVGPLPESTELYRERSPITHAAELHAPLLVLQGLDDQICQAPTTQRFVDAVRAAGGPIELRTYEGEQHGFRAATTIADAIEAEVAHFATVFGLGPADAS